METIELKRTIERKQVAQLFSSAQLFSKSLIDKWTIQPTNTVTLEQLTALLQAQRICTKDSICLSALNARMHSLDMAFNASRKTASTRQQTPTTDFSPHLPIQFPLGSSH